MYSCSLFIFKLDRREIHFYSSLLMLTMPFLLAFLFFESCFQTNKSLGMRRACVSNQKTEAPLLQLYGYWMER